MLNEHNNFTIIDYEEVSRVGHPAPYPASARYSVCQDSTPENDLVSVGLVLYERFGRLPWDGLHTKAEISEVQRAALADRSRFFGAANGLVGKLLGVGR